jgi:hypothetical protein
LAIVLVLVLSRVRSGEASGQSSTVMDESDVSGENVIWRNRSVKKEKRTGPGVFKDPSHPV